MVVMWQGAAIFGLRKQDCGSPCRGWDRCSIGMLEGCDLSPKAQRVNASYLSAPRVLPPTTKVRTASYNPEFHALQHIKRRHFYVRIWWKRTSCRPASQD